MQVCRCQFCSNPLEPAQELRYLVETATLDEPAVLDRIRTLPAAAGRPLRVCGGCQREMAAHPARFRAALEVAAFRSEVRGGLLAAAGLLSLGFLFLPALGDV